MPKMPEIKDVEALGDAVDMLNMKCERLIDKKDYKEAIKCYDEMVKTFAPAYFMANYKKGLIYLGMGENEKAKECFENALRMSPNNSGMLINLAFCEARMGQKGNARTLIQKAVEKEPNEVIILLLAAILCYELGDKGEGKKYIDSAMKVSPRTTVDLWGITVNGYLNDPDVSSEDKVELRAELAETKAYVEKIRVLAEAEKYKKK